VHRGPTGHNPEALVAIDRAPALEPIPLAHLNRALITVALGHGDDAVASVRAALTAQPALRQAVADDPAFETSRTRADFAALIKANRQ